MRVLVLGGAGMLGHRVYSYFKKSHTTGVTLRKNPDHYLSWGLFEPDDIVANVDVRDFKQVEAAMAAYRPDAVINCVGITNKGAAATDNVINIEVNALFPHYLAQHCRDLRIQMVHLSTDCVFSGNKGYYREEDSADADDLYGRTKFLGEVDNAFCLTIRTSMIGLGLDNKKGLIEWFLSQDERIRGYQNAIFSGFTTLEIARIIEKILLSGKTVSGPLHVSGEPISKYDLLSRLKAILGLSIDIIPDTDFKCDRSLDSTKFQDAFDYNPPTWGKMLSELGEQIKRERL